MPLSSRQLKNNLLFRASESITASAWSSKALSYLNRAYKNIAAGASEFLSEYVEDWWWLRARGNLTLEAVVEATVDVTLGSAAIGFTVIPDQSMEGWSIRIGDQADYYFISSHLAGATAATLDSEYTGATGVAASFKAMKVDYALPEAVSAIISPFSNSRGRGKINGISPETFSDMYPVPVAGFPEAFSLETENLVRFSHGGRVDGTRVRLDYLYRPVVAELVDSDSDFPLIPDQYRSTLEDAALVYLLMDKNDDRATAAATGARAGLAAMVRENRRRRIKLGRLVGAILPRQHAVKSRGPLRTESGLIIG